MSIQGFNNNYDAVIQLLKDRFDINFVTKKVMGPINGAEIGVRHGFFTEALYQVCEGLHMTCADPYAPYQDVFQYYHEEEQHKIWLEARDRLKPYKVNWLIMSSLEAAALVPDKSLDFVFIDAEHTYKACIEDLQAWFPKVKSGGFISGHDYCMKGVGEAVRDFRDIWEEDLHGIAHFDNPADVWAIGVK